MKRRTAPRWTALAAACLILLWAPVTEAGEADVVDVKITAQCNVSLNGRPPQLLIDPEVDLTTVRCTLKPTPWLLPLDTPLPPRRDYRKSSRKESQ